jgi:hypothetical protein
MIYGVADGSTSLGAVVGSGAVLVKGVGIG